MFKAAIIFCLGIALFLFGVLKSRLNSDYRPYKTLTFVGVGIMGLALIKILLEIF